MINLTKDNFQREVLESDIPVVVDFWAPWCGHCINLMPIIEELDEEAASGNPVRRHDHPNLRKIRKWRGYSQNRRRVAEGGIAFTAGTVMNKRQSSVLMGITIKTEPLFFFDLSTCLSIYVHNFYHNFPLIIVPF